MDEGTLVVLGKGAAGLHLPGDRATMDSRRQDLGSTIGCANILHNLPESVRLTLEEDASPTNGANICKTVIGPSSMYCTVVESLAWPGAAPTVQIFARQ